MEKLVGRTGDIILVTIALFLAVFILWANLATLEKVIRGEGKNAYILRSFKGGSDSVPYLCHVPRQG